MSRAYRFTTSTLSQKKEYEEEYDEEERDYSTDPILVFCRHIVRFLLIAALL